MHVSQEGGWGSEGNVHGMFLVTKSICESSLREDSQIIDSATGNTTVFFSRLGEGVLHENVSQILA